MNNPLVSIIIPTYNRAHLIGDTLDSVLGQTYENWECIIVDDGSTDNTKEVVDEYKNLNSRFQYHHRPNDRLKGANACRNYGFSMSQGEYAMFLDSDDICEIFCLSDRVALMIKDECLDLVIRDTSLLINNVKQSVSINRDPEKSSVEEYLRMFFRYEIPWTIMGALYKRYLLADNKFDENLMRFQDVSFNIKVLSRYDKLKFYRDYKIDTYYRLDESKLLNDSFIRNIFESLVVFYNLHNDLRNNISYKIDIGKFGSKIILLYGMPYFNQSKKEINLFFIWFLKSKMYNFNQKIVLLFLMFFLNSNLFYVKGIGMNKFRGLFKRITTI
jgi:glycosyltransferase involved in cell wall biosynthesis